MLEYKYQNFYDIIKNNAKNYPKKSAIFIDKDKINNKELKLKVDKLASYLKSIGIGKDDKVSIILANSSEFVIAFFAITKVGAVVVPINNFLKKDELFYIINDSKSKAFISSKQYKKELEGAFRECENLKNAIWIDEEIGDEKNASLIKIFEKSEFSEFDPSALLEDLACIIYTSGTTGKPKGAMLTYKNMFSNMVGAGIIFKISSKDRFIVYLPMFHSFTLTIMTILPLYYAASIVVIKSVFPFSNVLKQTLLKRVTIFLGVPTVYML